MIIIEGKVRSVKSKGTSRRLRMSNKLPAIVYGGKTDPIAIELDHDKLWNLQEKVAFYSDVLIINIKDKKEKVKVQAIQRHAFKPKLIHLDFIRVI